MIISHFCVFRHLVNRGVQKGCNCTPSVSFDKTLCFSFNQGDFQSFPTAVEAPQIQGGFYSGGDSLEINIFPNRRSICVLNASRSDPSPDFKPLEPLVSSRDFYGNQNRTLAAGVIAPLGAFCVEGSPFSMFVRPMSDV